MRFTLAIVATLAATAHAQIIELTTAPMDAQATRSTIEGPFPSPITGGIGDDPAGNVGSTPLIKEVTLTSQSASRVSSAAPTFTYTVSTTPSISQTVDTSTTTSVPVITATVAPAAAGSDKSNKSAGGYFAATVALAVLCGLEAIVIGVLAYRTRRLTQRRDRLARFYPAPEAQPQQNYVPHSAKAYTYEAPRLSADSPPPTASTFQPSPVVRKVSRKAPPLYLEKPEGEY